MRYFSETAFMCVMCLKRGVNVRIFQFGESGCFVLIKKKCSIKFVLIKFCICNKLIISVMWN